MSVIDMIDRARDEMHRQASSARLAGEEERAKEIMRKPLHEFVR